MTSDEHIDPGANATRFSGFADLYDRVRPRPPRELADVLTMYVGRRSPEVVDLGSGTGLSTRWASQWAASVIGVEPSADMRAMAEAHVRSNVRFVDGFGHETGLEPDSADVVIAVQSLHWMEPSSTFAEVARILRPGGVFAAIDCDWPPTIGLGELEQAWAECRTSVHIYKARRARKAEGDAIQAPVRHDPLAVTPWSKDLHLERMQNSGHFAWCHELALHAVERGGADRFVALLRSQGDYQALLRHGFDDDVLGVADFEKKTWSVLGTEIRTWWFTYRVRIGVLVKNE